MNPLLIADAVPDSGTGYALAGYIFFLVLILIYVGILAAKFQRLNRKVGELEARLEETRGSEPGPAGGQ